MQSNAAPEASRNSDCLLRCSLCCCLGAGSQSSGPHENKRQPEKAPPGPIQGQPQSSSRNDRHWETNPPRTFQDEQRLTPSEVPDETSSFAEKNKKIQKIMKVSLQMQKKNLKVGIFSRSAESDYEWLKTKLESGSFKNIVYNVQSYYISNNGFLQFSEDVSLCTFGILYHTKNRGRVNLTNVTDSLYDDELKYLSEKLEKKNVIVVIDDLTDSGQEEKDRILNAQPRLKEWAEEVLFFSADEKM